VRYENIERSLTMPYVNKKRPYKKEYQQQRKRNEQKNRNARERARYALDKKGVKRKGKDIDHIKPLSRGGTNNFKNLRVVSKNKNRSFKRNSDKSVKKNA
jgi:5-methylcytosine-specific restriction endonuclease McrA